MISEAVTLPSEKKRMSEYGNPIGAARSAITQEG